MKVEDLEFGSGFAGYIDGLIPDPDVPGGYIVADFKTKDKSKVGYSKYDFHHHRAQVLSYRCLLEKHPHSLNITGQAVIYIARDLSTFDVVEIPTDEYCKMEFEKYVRDEKKKRDALASGHIADIPALCSSAQDEPFCPYNHLCFGPNPDIRSRSEWEKGREALGQQRKDHDGKDPSGDKI